jgi:hypothetical protein
MKIALGPSLVVEYIPSALELRAMTLQKQAQTRRTGIRAEPNPIYQMPEKSRHN